MAGLPECPPLPSSPVYKKTLRMRYEKMSATARGVRLHKDEAETTLRKAKPPPDRTAWVREDKQHSPYSYFDSSAVQKQTPKPKKQSAPPLWFPNRDKTKGATSSAEASSASGTPSPGPPWDTEHHIKESKGNTEVTHHGREYFDRPLPKDSEGVVKIFERYSMNDHQTRWNDHPNGTGSRNTYLDHCCTLKEIQAVPYWRNVKNWGAFSTPDFHDHHRSIAGGRTSQSPKRSMLESLADTPAQQSTEFWRTWAGQHSKVPKVFVDKPEPQAWNARHSMSGTVYNMSVDPRNREYFSVPELIGGQGRAMVGPGQRVWHANRRSYDRFAEGEPMYLA